MACNYGYQSCGPSVPLRPLDKRANNGVRHSVPLGRHYAEVSETPQSTERYALHIF